MKNKIKNLINNYERYGASGVLKFYFENKMFGEQIKLNTIILAKCLTNDFLNFSSINLFVKKFSAYFHIIPKVSIIMSVYNGEPFLRESIDSILSQDFKDFEFLIMDDGSADGSYAILKEYARKDKRIKIFKNEENLGLTKSLNLLLKHSKGLFIARMDSDDVSLQRRLRIEYEFLTRNSNIFLVGTRVFHIDSKSKIIAHPILPTNSLEISDLLPKTNCIYHPTIMFRNEEYNYREKFLYAQDYDFYLNLLSAGKNFYNLKDTLLLYRITNDSLSKRKGQKQKEFADKARTFYLERIEKGTDSYDSFTL